MSKANKGKQLSEEHKIKLSIAHKGKKKSPEHIAKMIANRKEKVKNNPEHRAFLKEISKKAAKSINFPRGSNSKHAKLHEDDVVKIKQLVADGIAAKDVAIQFNVSKRTILNIINKTSWRHVI
jgi:transcription initiation factor IIF auxiliary subunit